ncbi:hypothetical protein [Luteibacter sp. dw_328]|uniref:hypothetical protein n=1 Tax=Luteibacter sp. dw_328 TaxID=2719796 RepID=UPI001BD4F630|nr:hypothetical protein [Luteibacter sp. dw_328]
MRELLILMNGAMVREHAAASKLPAIGLGLKCSVVAENPYPLDAAGSRDVPGRLHVVKTDIVSIAFHHAEVAVFLTLEDRPRPIPILTERVRNTGRAQHHHVVADGVDHG